MPIYRPGDNAPIYDFPSNLPATPRWVCLIEHGLPYGAITSKPVGECATNDLEAALKAIRELPKPASAQRCALLDDAMEAIQRAITVNTLYARAQA
jgi:hypothetical protein